MEKWLVSITTSPLSFTSLFISLATTASSSRWSTLIFSLFSAISPVSPATSSLPSDFMPSVSFTLLSSSPSVPVSATAATSSSSLLALNRDITFLTAFFTIDCSSAFSCSASFFSSTFSRLTFLNLTCTSPSGSVSTPSAISLISSALYWLISLPSSSAFFCRASSTFSCCSCVISDTFKDSSSAFGKELTGPVMIISLSPIFPTSSISPVSCFTTTLKPWVVWKDFPLIL